MKSLFLGLLLALAAVIPAKADWSYVGKNGFIVATTQPCPDNIKARIKPEHQDKFRYMTGQVEGSLVHGCWILQEDNVFIIWDDGDVGMVPQNVFTKLKES